MFVPPMGINFILPVAGKGWGLSAINRGMTMQGRGRGGTCYINARPCQSPDKPPCKHPPGSHLPGGLLDLFPLPVFPYFASMPSSFWERVRNLVISSASRGWAAMRARSYTCSQRSLVVSSSASRAARA